MTKKLKRGKLPYKFAFCPGVPRCSKRRGVLFPVARTWARQAVGKSEEGPLRLGHVQEFKLPTVRLGIFMGHDKAARRLCGFVSNSTSHRSGSPKAVVELGRGFTLVGVWKSADVDAWHQYRGDVPEYRGDVLEYGGDVLKYRGISGYPEAT